LNYVGNRNSASYTNVAPGNYVFKVKYKNAAGLWSAETKGLEIIIVPPFWLTWWFKIAVFVLLIGCIYVFLKNRLRKIKSQKRILEKLVEERTERLEQMTIDERQSRNEAEKAVKKQKKRVKKQKKQTAPKAFSLLP
jgi:biopolymer transport protein ExbB/TolQ